jgi:hypothetical protein
MNLILVIGTRRIYVDIRHINAPTTIDGIKELIAPDVGIPAEDQCILLEYPGPTGYKEMRGEQTLGECGIITPNVQLFLWPSTDPVVMRVRDYEEREREMREMIERLTQIFQRQLLRERLNRKKPEDPSKKI